MPIRATAKYNTALRVLHPGLLVFAPCGAGGPKRPNSGAVFCNVS